MEDEKTTTPETAGKCPECGLTNASEAKYCRDCGTPLATMEAEAKPTVETPKPKVRLGKKTTIIAVAAIAVVALAAGGTFAYRAHQEKAHDAALASCESASRTLKESASKATDLYEQAGDAENGAVSGIPTSAYDALNDARAAIEKASGYGEVQRLREQYGISTPKEGSGLPECKASKSTDDLNGLAEAARGQASTLDKAAAKAEKALEAFSKASDEAEHEGNLSDLRQAYDNLKETYDKANGFAMGDALDKAEKALDAAKRLLDADSDDAKAIEEAKQALYDAGSNSLQASASDEGGKCASLEGTYKASDGYQIEIGAPCYAAFSDPQGMPTGTGSGVYEYAKESMKFDADKGVYSWRISGSNTLKDVTLYPAGKPDPSNGDTSRARVVIDRTYVKED